MQIPAKIAALRTVQLQYPYFPQCFPQNYATISALNPRSTLKMKWLIESPIYANGRATMNRRDWKGKSKGQGALSHQGVFRGVAQVIRKTSKVASSRKFPPQKAVTCCMMTR